MNKYLEKALEVAKTSKCRYKHGAIVVLNGKIIAEATNKKVGDVSDKDWRRSHIHAETAAVLAAGKRARRAVLYVARVAADGGPAESRPCKRCEGYLERVGISQVVWT